MKTATLKLCLPVIAVTAQQNVAGLIVPPFLQSAEFPVAMIGSLISLGPVLALASRIPSGLAYTDKRARALMSLALLAMAATNFLYSYAVTSLTFAVVHGVNGFAYGAATTLYLAFYIGSLPPDEDRNHAMGYYAGSLALGYSTGNFLAGFVADRFGYEATFQLAALLSFLCAGLLFTLKKSAASSDTKKKDGGSPRPNLNWLQSLKSAWEPKLAAVAVVALFLNLLHQMANVFLPLYGLAVGLTLTQVGVIKGFYALCNAITRPISGLVVKRLGHRRLSYGGMPVQSAFVLLIPFCADFITLLIVHVSAGFVRAVAIVSNSISLVQETDEARVPRGVSSGLYNAAGDLGNIVGPSMGGLIASVTGVANLFMVGPLITAVLFFISLWACRFIAPKPSTARK
ncbi:MAG TPA: MFS transporter [Candidatus Binatia bacterium]|jgi:predicted MFS family arabinose efflux permease